MRRDATHEWTYNDYSEWTTDILHLMQPQDYRRKEDGAERKQ